MPKQEEFRPSCYRLRAISTLSKPPQPLLLSTLPLPSLLNALLLSQSHPTIPLSTLPSITHRKVLSLLTNHIVRTSPSKYHAQLTALVLSLSYSHSPQAYRRLCSAFHVRTLMPSAPLGVEDRKGRMLWWSNENKRGITDGEVAVGVMGGVVASWKGKVWRLCANSGKAVWISVDGMKVDENFKRVSRRRYVPTATAQERSQGYVGDESTQEEPC